jgi:hypothetical protein
MILSGFGKTDSQRGGVNFSALVESTTYFGGQAGCGVMTTAGCTTVDCEKGTDSDTLGPVAMFISNSLAEIHGMYKSYYDTLFKALTIVSMALDDMENKFAPIPLKEDNTWKLILINVIMLGALGTAGPFFNMFLKKHDWFAGKIGSALDNTKDTAMTLIGQSTTIAKDALPGGDVTKWTLKKQDEFSAYLGQVIYG